MSSVFGHSKIPLEDVQNATNNFADENLVGQGGYMDVYKGQLFRHGQMINIVARKLHRTYDEVFKGFWTYISIVSSLRHQNLVDFIGYCDENIEYIIVNKYEAKGSLDRYLSDPNLTWTQRLKICVGVARALSYIHYDEARDFSVVHRNIKSSKILLDDSWQPKLSGFELSLKCTNARRRSLILAPLAGSIGYVDPKYEVSGSVSHKSDVYSFGIVLFEILCGTRAFISGEPQLSKQHSHEKKANEIVDPDLNKQMDDQTSSTSTHTNEVTPKNVIFTMIDFEYSRTAKQGLVFLADLAKSNYENRTLDDMIDRDLRRQMDPESYKVFSETAYCCLKDQRSQRPHIDQVLVALENALEFQLKRESDI
ncbi:receptor-like protein kinase HERK 1 [Rutidosis leptorrhynchoides]|uniref:receptor-like protein kinase HERK 1 n=1 Tax=Rutidosis leptorrhynchoides TaxID=125765 RepID=UPI003A992CF5